MIDDTTIREPVKRLARQDRSGAQVIERAAILAAGSDSELIVAWILARGGQPEAMTSAVRRGGLHGARVNGGVVTDSATPRRYVLPPDALS